MFTFVIHNANTRVNEASGRHVDRLERRLRWSSPRSHQPRLEFYGYARYIFIARRRTEGWGSFRKLPPRIFGSAANNDCRQKSSWFMANPIVAFSGRRRQVQIEASLAKERKRERESHLCKIAAMVERPRATRRETTSAPRWLIALSSSAGRFKSKIIYSIWDGGWAPSGMTTGNSLHYA